jgi:hypothetical protein
MPDPQQAIIIQLEEKIIELEIKLRVANELREKAQMERNAIRAECNRIWIRRVTDMRRIYRRFYAITKLYVDSVTCYYLLAQMGMPQPEHPERTKLWQELVMALHDCNPGPKPVKKEEDPG